MKLIRTEDAVGSVLCHDITQIIPGVVKDAVFRKGHVVTEEDILSCFLWGKSTCTCGRSRKGCSMRMTLRKCSGRYAREIT